MIIASDERYIVSVVDHKGHVYILGRRFNNPFLFRMSIFLGDPHFKYYITSLQVNTGRIVEGEPRLHPVTSFDQSFVNDNLVTFSIGHDKTTDSDVTLTPLVDSDEVIEWRKKGELIDVSDIDTTCRLDTYNEDFDLPTYLEEHPNLFYYLSPQFFRGISPS